MNLKGACKKSQANFEFLSWQRRATERVGSSVTPYIYIRDVLGTNIGQDTEY
jgi:hypothetical protein